MTLLRWLGVWLLMMVGGTVLELTRISREIRLGESLGALDAQPAWTELPATLALVYAGVSSFSLMLLLLGVPGKINQARVRHGVSDDQDAVVRGFWNFALSREWRAPLCGVSSLNVATTVLLATHEGIRLFSGLLTRALVAEFDWDQIDEIRVGHLDAGKHVVAGPAIFIRVSGFERPLIFSVISDRFPWFAVGSARFAEETAQSLCALRDAIRRQ